MSKEVYTYSEKEENLNVISHAIGFIASICAFPFLILKSLYFSGFWKPFSLYVFGVSLMVLYAASTFYHASKKPTLRRRLHIFDHAAIYVLIAGTYTPFTLITLEGKTRWTVFFITWSVALVGIVLKLFFTGRFNKLSTLLYVLMGWQIVFSINPLLENLSTEGIQWLFTGGVFYTVGAVLYLVKKLPYNHAIFHLFVLLGSLSHFIAIYNYL
ncbi:MAG: hemolysin III family protein [Flavobacteriaceae bacterium]|nr:hemolysin III family protein [Flavobacteriaceae bacterium]